MAACCCTTRESKQGTSTFNRFALNEKQTLTLGLELLEIRLVC